MQPWVENNIISPSELNYVKANLKHLAEKSTELPFVQPRLIDMVEAANMLGISETTFKKQEKEKAFTFKRKMIGTNVRYRNTDILQYIMSNASEQ